MLDKNLSTLSKILIYITLIVFACILIIPFVYMISIALASPDTNIKEQFTLLPREFYFNNFINLFKDSISGERPILLWFFNTMIVVLLSIVGQIFSSTLVAFGFARMKFKHKNKLFLLVLGTMMLPGQITLIPVFIIFRNLGLFNTLWPLIIPQFFGSAYNIFFTRQFITAIPGSLFEAAEMDGLGPIGSFTKIVLPLIKPAMAAIAIFTFNFAWSDIMGPLIYVSDTSKMTLALGAQTMSATSNPSGAVNMSMLMVMSLALTLPQIVVYFLGQKYLFQINLGIGNSGTK